MNGDAFGAQTAQKPQNVGGLFRAQNAYTNIGVFGRAQEFTIPTATNTAGYFEAYSGETTFGVRSIAQGATKKNVGVSGLAYNTLINNPANATLENLGGDFKGMNSLARNYGVRAYGSGGPQTYGVYAVAQFGTVNNIGVYASVVNTGTNRSGYFVGQMETTGGALISSDSMFKTNVVTLESGLKTVIQLKPVTYYMDNTNFGQFNFGSEKQYGFIAQQVDRLDDIISYEVRIDPLPISSLSGIRFR